MKRWAGSSTGTGRLVEGYRLCELSSATRREELLYNSKEVIEPSFMN